MACSLLGSPIFCNVKEYSVNNGNFELSKKKGTGIYFERETRHSSWSVERKKILTRSFEDKGSFPNFGVSEETFWVLEVDFNNGSYALTYFDYSSTSKDPPLISPENMPLFQEFHDISGLTFYSCKSEFRISNGFKGWCFSYKDESFGETPAEVNSVTIFEGRNNNYNHISSYNHWLPLKRTPQEIQDIRYGRTPYPLGTAYVKDVPFEKINSKEDYFIPDYPETNVSFWDKVKKTISSWF